IKIRIGIATILRAILNNLSTISSFDKSYPNRLPIRTHNKNITIKSTIISNMLSKKPHIFLIFFSFYYLVFLSY
ncbi:hypothetical protein, partial [Brochothrix thermosphacta]|uniref:hypothetical protein n=1 Tax=Brochothrix thermosphacta TaxID=2756 RepID=UPI001C402BB7